MRRTCENQESCSDVCMRDKAVRMCIAVWQMMNRFVDGKMIQENEDLALLKS